MSSSPQIDLKKLFNQLGRLLIVSAITAFFFSLSINELSFGAVFFSIFIFSFLLYPIIYLRSWVQDPPSNFIVRVFIHLTTLPTIIYYLLLILFLVQYVFADFSFMALLLTGVLGLVTAYLIQQYARFIKNGG